MNRQSICRGPNQGSVLIVCLWTIMILAILGMGITGLVFQEARLSKAYFRLVTSLPIARAAAKTVFYLREKDATPAYDTREELSKEERVTLCAGNSYRYSFADKINSHDDALSSQIIDEGALINLNIASADVLARLPGMNEDLAEALVNSNLRPFSTINEVLLVNDISKERFLLFKDSVTVYGNGKVNINTVSKAVLMALGLDDEVANLVLRFRDKNKIKPPLKEPGTEQGAESSEEPEEGTCCGISSLATLLNDLKESASLYLRQEQDLLMLLPALDVRSEYLRFNVVPESGGKSGTHYSIVIHPAAKKILSWSEY